MTHDDPTPISAPTPLSQPSGYQQVQMRGPADMAAMLPYLLGFYPDDSIVAVGLQGPAYQQGGTIRLDIPQDPRHWPLVATEVARLLIELSEQRDRRPQAVLLYLCRDPEPGGPPVLAGLRPLADHLLRAFREVDLPVKESLCVSGGRWWSYLCADPVCCHPEGTAVHAGQDPRAVVAAATFAGLAPRGSRKAIAAALTPVGPPAEAVQREAVERQMAAMVKELTNPDGPDRVLAATGRLIDRAMAEFRTGAPALDDERAARLILGLQDRSSRDRAAEYAEPDELACAQRLWRFLARRCVPPFEEYAKAPLTLLAWVSWLAGDIATSRVVLGKALDLDPSYTLAELLYHSLNGGLEPDALLAAVRAERARRRAPDTEPQPPGAAGARGAAARPGRKAPPGGPAAGPAADPGAPEDGKPGPVRPPGAGAGGRIPRQRQGGGPRPPQASMGPVSDPDPDPPTDGPAAPSVTATSGRLARLTGRDRRRGKRRHGKTRDPKIGA